MTIDESPFGRIVRQPIPPPFDWTGELTLRFPHREITGRGTINADRNQVAGQVTHVDEELLAAAARGPVPFVHNHTPGVLLTTDRFATGSAGDLSWTARDCIITGRQLGDSAFSFRDKFICRELSVNGASREDRRYLRVLYSSAHLSSATHGTVHERGWSRDAIDGHFQKGRLHLRSLNGDELPMEEQIVAATTDAALSDEQLTALWLAVGFIVGNGVHEYCREYYDSDGVLCCRVCQPGTPATHGRMPAFHLAYVPFQSEQLATIADGFYRMIAGRFPIGVILQHLHASNSGNAETDLQSLLLSIHTAIEAWNRAFGRVAILPSDVWNDFRPSLIEAVTPLREQVGQELPEEARRRLDVAALFTSILNKLNSANHTPTNQKERDLFATLQIALSKEDRGALASRNQLLHNGYFLKRFEELSPEEKQQRIDLGPRLRNLVNQILLRCCGFRGDVLEMTRARAVQIDSAFSPLFNVRNDGLR